jgi:hypothetical protein
LYCSSVVFFKAILDREHRTIPTSYILSQHNRIRRISEGIQLPGVLATSSYSTSSTTTTILTYLNFGTTGLFVTASATHPPIKHSPPSGVTGPTYFPNRCGSRTSRYKLPENIVMPAVSRPMATVFWGATTEAKVRTAE